MVGLETIEEGILPPFVKSSDAVMIWREGMGLCAAPAWALFVLWYLPIGTVPEVWWCIPGGGPPNPLMSLVTTMPPVPVPNVAAAAAAAGGVVFEPAVLFLLLIPARRCFDRRRSWLTPAATALSMNRTYTANVRPHTGRRRRVVWHVVVVVVVDAEEEEVEGVEDPTHLAVSIGLSDTPANTTNPTASKRSTDQVTGYGMYRLVYPVHEAMDQRRALADCVMQVVSTHTCQCICRYTAKGGSG